MNPILPKPKDSSGITHLKGKSDELDATGNISGRDVTSNPANPTSKKKQKA